MDPHFISRGFPATVDDDILGLSCTTGAVPFASGRTTFTVNRAPAVGEQNDPLEAL
jgi:hypothetical protein